MFTSSVAQNSSSSNFNWMEDTAKILNFGSPTTLVLALVLLLAVVFVAAVAVATVVIMVVNKFKTRLSTSSLAKEESKATLLRSDSLCAVTSSHQQHSVAGYWWDEGDYN
jgi:flagellar basal body-associated protein FliL